MFVEIEKFQIVIDELLKGTESKNPKVSTACLILLKKVLEEFGPVVITSNVDKVLGRVSILLEYRDKGVRREARLLLMEMIFWFGDRLKPKLAAALRPTLVKEITEDCEQVKDKEKTPKRLLRSSQRKEVEASHGSEASASEHGEFGNELGHSDTVKPVNILVQLTDEFHKKLNSKKWVERKESLEDLEKLLQSAKALENGNYCELLTTLTKTIQKDSNIAVVSTAIRCVGGISKGLKKKFLQYTDQVLPVLLKKFKEKRIGIVTALRDSVDEVHMCTNLETIKDHILCSLEDKNPSVKAEGAAFLTRCLSKTPQALNKKQIKTFCVSLSHSLRDQDPAVRENSAMALGTLMKIVGEKSVCQLLDVVDDICLKKVKDYCEKAQIARTPCKTREKKILVPKCKEVVENIDTPVKKALSPVLLNVPLLREEEPKKVDKEVEANLPQQEQPQTAPLSFVDQNSCNSFVTELDQNEMRVFHKVMCKLQAHLKLDHSITPSSEPIAPYKCDENLYDETLSFKNYGLNDQTNLEPHQTKDVDVCENINIGEMARLQLKKLLCIREKAGLSTNIEEICARLEGIHTTRHTCA